MSTDTAKSDFEALLGEITDMTKAFPKDKDDTKKADVKIDAAAADGVDESDAADADKDKTDVTKSFKLKLDDGTEIDAIDGAELFKSLTARVEKHETESLSAVRGLTDLVKSLVGTVASLSNKGVGRKTVVAIAEKTPAATQDVNKSDTGVSAEDFMAKAMSMQAEGKLAGVDVRRAEAYLNAGKSVPAEIIHRVLGSK
ncbi:MAG TPA: hypothetical protein DEQ40_08150 [Oxalobacteraceae bacterium]|jgi:hypothetical protein|nr:hypothetical protein [Oxalobacteraceae bacterium]